MAQEPAPEPVPEPEPVPPQNPEPPPAAAEQAKPKPLREAKEVGPLTLSHDNERTVWSKWDEGVPPLDDALTEAQSERAVGSVMVYMALKVMADTATTSVWPLLLRDAYGGDVVAATTAAATMSSACGVAELLINPMVGKLSDRFGRKAFFYLGPAANCLTSLCAPFALPGFACG